MKERRFRLGREWNKGVWFYVRELPGDGGKDWGYVMHPQLATPHTEATAKRWRKHCVDMGVACSVVELVE